MTKNTALLLIDVQVGFFSNNPAVHDAETMLARIKSLIKRAQDVDMPIVYVQHDSEPEIDGPIHPEIIPSDSESIVHKFTPDSFYETNLHDLLQAKGIKNLIIAGFQTEFCIDTTTRRARSMDYKVTLVGDAHSTSDYAWNVIPATQIIAHHNKVLAEFADVRLVEEITFS